MNTEYGNIPSVMMAIEDKYCLVSTTCFMRRREWEKNCADTLHTEGEIFNLTFIYQSRRRQSDWKCKAYSRLMMLTRLVTCSVPHIFHMRFMIVTCDKERTEWETVSFAFICICISDIRSPIAETRCECLLNKDKETASAWYLLESSSCTLLHNVLIQTALQTTTYVRAIV